MLRPYPKTGNVGVPNDWIDWSQVGHDPRVRRGRHPRARDGHRGGSVPRGAGGPVAGPAGLRHEEAQADREGPGGAREEAGLETAPRVLQSFPVAPATGEPPKAGETVTVAIFAEGDRVKVTGVTKGRGFQGVVHRHHFGGGPETHGNTRHRKPGSIAPGTDPSRIIKGKRMPGHMGARNFTELGLRVVKVDAERNLLFLRGAVPGPMNGLLTVRKQGGPSRHD